MTSHLIPISMCQYSSFRKVKWKVSRPPLYCAGYERQRETGARSGSVFIRLCVRESEEEKTVDDVNGVVPHTEQCTSAW
jgi:hypothetical protein